MKVIEILDRAKQIHGYRTDMALADALGVGRASVSAWRHGTRAPDPVQCEQLAKMAELELVAVIAAAGEARAISASEKAVWRKLANAAAIAFLLLGSGRPAVSAELATLAIADLNDRPSMHYAKLRARLILGWLRGQLARFQRVTALSLGATRHEPSALLAC